MRHLRENFKYAGSLEEVIKISRKMKSKTLNIEQRKESHKKHMRNYRENAQC